MKRYLLFTFQSHYPCGGWNDILSTYDDLQGAIDEGERLISERSLLSPDHYHVVDIQLGEIVSKDKFHDV